MRVNKLELSRLLNISVPTLNAWILKYADAFPVIERGTNGKDWAFDAIAVRAFLAGKQEEEQRSAAARNEQIRQLSLPMGHNGGPAIDGEVPPAPMRPADLLAMAKLRRMEREEAYECGRLVRVTELQATLDELTMTWDAELRTAVRRFGSMHSLSDEMVDELEGMLHACQGRLVAQMRNPKSSAAEPELLDWISKAAE